MKEWADHRNETYERDVEEMKVKVGQAPTLTGTVKEVSDSSMLSETLEKMSLNDGPTFQQESTMQNTKYEESKE